MNKTILNKEIECNSSVNKWVEELSWALDKTLSIKGVKLDPQLISSCISELSDEPDSKELAGSLQHIESIYVCSYQLKESPELPLLTRHSLYGWGVLHNKEINNKYVFKTVKNNFIIDVSEVEDTLIGISINANYSEEKNSSFTSILRTVLFEQLSSMGLVIIASIIIGLFSLITSLFSMQVYDRVIPSNGKDTLLVLSVGVIISIIVELIMKFSRSRILDNVSIKMDYKLSRVIFERFLSIRLDQMPASVGSLAGQLRGYEQVRTFFTSSTLFAIVDMPLSIIYFLLMISLAGIQVAIIPLSAAVVALIIGYIASRNIQSQASLSTRLNNLKVGVLVETIEGAETIKSGSSAWKFLSRWTNLTGRTINNDLRMRHINDGMTYITATVQQISYIGVVVVGALVIMDGEITTGALIACSILSGRVLAPILSLPGIMIQFSHTRSAIRSLDALFALKCDYSHVVDTLKPQSIKGIFSMKDVYFSWTDKTMGLEINNLKIKQGEKVAVIGPIGAGKSTLLRLLCGLYTAERGQVIIDGLDISQVDRFCLNRDVGYLQQEHRLFHGTIRENILTGLGDIDDETLMNALAMSGMDSVISSHPAGLDRVISEGGKGLSGGQRQLLAFTRVFITNRNAFLLDEPTGNMDHEQETRCINVIKSFMHSDTTLVVVTHKPQLLALVDRIIIIADNKIVMDGERNAIINKLRNQK